MTTDQDLQEENHCYTQTTLKAPWGKGLSKACLLSNNLSKGDNNTSNNTFRTKNFVWTRRDKLGGTQWGPNGNLWSPLRFCQGLWETSMEFRAEITSQIILLVINISEDTDYFLRRIGEKMHHQGESWVPLSKDFDLAEPSACCANDNVCFAKYIEQQHHKLCISTN